MWFHVDTLLRVTFVAVSLCGVAGLAGTFPSLSLPVSGPLLLDLPGFHVPSDGVFPSRPRFSSRALPLHLHFRNSSDVYCSMSWLNVPEPFLPSPSHDHRNRLHPCSLQDLLISPMFQQAHPHCPSHHPHICCWHTLFIFCWHWPCFAAVKQRYVYK